MIKLMIKSALAGTLFLSAVPALATPFCGATPRIATLKRLWADPKGPLMITAHRGDHLKAPENSLTALDNAVASGADFVEIDVRVSSDGVPFIMHDGSVDRTTNGSGKAEAMTYAQLRQLRLKGGDTPPPTLIEALRTTCGRVLVDLDMKTSQVAPVVAVIEGLGMTDQVEMFHGNSEVLRSARALLPDLQVMPRLHATLPLAEITRGLGPVRIVHGDFKSLTPETRDAVRAMPARIWANALGFVDLAVTKGGETSCIALKSMTDRGVTNFQTNYPALIRAELRRCGFAKPAKR
jgi:glycerophosphoryl diester phosphodiesterase